MKPKRSWRTTLLGIGTLAMTGISVAANPTQALSQQGIAQIIAQATAGVGLIAARDQKTHEEEQKP